MTAAPTTLTIATTTKGTAPMLATRLASHRARAAATPVIGTAAAIGALVAAHGFVDLVSGTLGALLPMLKDRFQLTSMQAGALVATVAVSTSLSQPLVGRVADRFGARRIAGVGAVLCSALLALLGVAPALWLVFVLVIAGGLGSAAFHPAAVVLARRVLPERAQLAVSLFAAGGMVGMAFGPLAVLLIAAHAGLGFTPLLMIPGVILGDILWRFLPAEPHAPRGARAGQARQLLRGPVGHLALGAGLMSLALTTFGAGLPLWLTEESGYASDATPIGITLAVFQVGAAVGGLTIGWVVSRVAPARLATASMLLAAPMFLLVLALEAGSAAFYAAAVVAGLVGNAATPLLIVGAQERAPHAVAAASGMVMGLANGAAGLAFIGIGALADATSLRAGLTVGFAAAIPAAVIARRALSSRPASAPQQLVGALCGCVACGCAIADTRCDDNCVCSMEVTEEELV